MTTIKTRGWFTVSLKNLHFRSKLAVFYPHRIQFSGNTNPSIRTQWAGESFVFQ